MATKKTRKKGKKKSKKKRVVRKKKPVQSASKGFGHLVIPKDVKVKDSGVVYEGDKDIDSLECWESYDWDEE